MPAAVDHRIHIAEPRIPQARSTAGERMIAGMSNSFPEPTLPVRSRAIVFVSYLDYLVPMR
ncbi:MAG: hypothetical protein ABI368_08975 [Jatrophihabitantaceae bacterium]